MRLLETWVETPLAGAVGWTLLHSLWEGAILSLVLAAVLVATRSPRIRYAAACLAMLAMIGGFGITLVYSFPEGSDGPAALGTSALPAWNVKTDMATLYLSNPGLAAAAPWLAPFWIAGVWIFYLRQMAGWIWAGRMRRRGVCCVSEQWQRQLSRLGARLRMSRSVRLLESSLADAPMVLGHFRPVILIPAGMLAGLPAGQIEAILLHELAHIRRYDYLVNVLQRAVEGILFYHPAMWWISRIIRAEREHCCDDIVVATRGNAHEYAVALAALEQSRWSGREAAVAATGGSLVKRIRRLLDPKGPNGAWSPLFAAVILMATAAATLAAWQSAPTPYDKWLNEDVVYIVNDQERAAFEKLASDEERQKFIEQFWVRRDPTPGTPKNEFKEEHYRRIARSMEKFRAASGRAGWRTDRGHMYIVYGPPDELETHPKAAQRPYATEVWLYRHMEGIGDMVTLTFIDRTGTGDYQLAPGKGVVIR